MNLYFDHIVHFVHNPIEIKSKFQQLGFHAVTGGNHPNWGTYNTLCYFEKLKYVEWIGLKDAEITQSVDHPFSQMIVQKADNGEGFSQIALRTHDIKELKERFLAKGINVLGPFEGSRKRADGSFLEWSMLFLEDQLEMPLPFFIDWQSSDQQREKELLHHNVIAKHQIGRTDLSYIGYVVKDLEATVQSWVQWFDAVYLDETVYYDPAVQADYNVITLGGVTIKFFKPQQEGIAANFLQQQGEGPFIAGIENSKLDQLINISDGYYQFKSSK